MSEVTPVELLYVRPVAVFAKRPRRYAGVSAVVDAAAASHDAMSPEVIPAASDAVKIGSDSVARKPSDEVATHVGALEPFDWRMVPVVPAFPLTRSVPVILVSPATVSVYPGVVVPMPTLPAEVMRTLSTSDEVFPLKIANAPVAGEPIPAPCVVMLLVPNVLKSSVPLAPPLGLISRLYVKRGLLSVL